MVPASGSAGGSWGQQQAEVAVGDPARLQELPERIRAKLSTARPPPSLASMLGESGYPVYPTT